MLWGGEAPPTSCILFLALAGWVRQGLPVLGTRAGIQNTQAGPLMPLPSGRSFPTSCTLSSGRGPPTTWQSATSRPRTGTCTLRMCVYRWKPSSGERSIIGTSPLSRCVAPLSAALQHQDVSGDEDDGGACHRLPFSPSQQQLITTIMY